MDFKQQFVVVYRNIAGDIEIQVTDDLYDACALQMAFITSEPTEENIEECRTLVEKDMPSIIRHLETTGNDRLSNEREEAWIFLLPATEDKK